MYIVGPFIQVALLWFLITVFTDSRDSSQSLRETWIVILGVFIVGVFSKLLLGEILGSLTFLIDVVALYFLVEKICEPRRGKTIRICIWYFVLSFLIWTGISLLAF